jgi:acetate---CoA ligase (ADP-forming)
MKVLDVYESEEMLSKLIPVAKSELVKSHIEVEEIAHKIGYPLILKVVSKHALHKSDVGGVKTVYNENELHTKFGRLISNLRNKRIPYQGILVQEFIDGDQMFIGINKDPSFGHVIGIGFGGVAIDAMKDVQFRVCPLNSKDVDSMLNHLQMKGLLFSTRKNLNLKSYKDMILKVSEFSSKHKNLKELDINPCILNSKGCVVVDSRMVFE